MRSECQLLASRMRAMAGCPAHDRGPSPRMTQGEKALECAWEHQNHMKPVLAHKRMVRYKSVPHQLDG